MIADRRLLVCAALSVVAHAAFARGLRRLPPHSQAPSPRAVSFRLLAPPPPPPSVEPPPELETPLKATTPAPIVRQRSRPRVAASAPAAAVPREVTPSDGPSLIDDPSPTPIFGVTMESTSQGGDGPAMPIGNSARPGGGRQKPADHAAPAAGDPVAAYEVTTMPLPQGRCAGAYTDDAKRAGLEGTVVLDLIVTEDGRVRDVQVVSGLGHGLTESAIRAVKECRFTPGEKQGTPVAVRVRGFKVRFLLDNDQ